MIVPTVLESAARRLIGSQVNDNGASNPWYQSAKLIVTPWLD